MAVRVDAAGDVINRTANLPSTTSFTACGWAYRVATNSGGALFDFRNAGYTQYFGLYESGANLQLDTSGGSTTVALPSTGTWFFFAITGNGTGAGSATVRTLLAGASSFTTASTTGASFTPSRLALGSDTFTPLNARFAAAKVWDRVLTEAELFTEAQFYTAVFRDSQRYEWPLLDSTDTRDLSGNGWGPTLTNVATEDGPPIRWSPGGYRYKGSRAAAGPGGGFQAAWARGSNVILGVMH